MILRVPFNKLFDSLFGKTAHTLCYMFMCFLWSSLFTKNHVPFPRAKYPYLLTISSWIPHGFYPHEMVVPFCRDVNKQHSITSHKMSQKISHEISWIIPYLVVSTTQLVSELVHPTYKIL